MRSFTLFRSMAALLLAPGCNAALTSLHGCGGTGQQYQQQANYAPYADDKGFIVVYPTSHNDSNCWDVSFPKSLTHSGGGDSEGLVNMVAYLVKTYNADRPKSGCFAGSPGNSPITSNRTCANGNVNKSGAEWAAQVHVMYPSYNGTYPHMQTFH
ncbi:phb depolymerase family esterase [Seiridium cupressi]